VSNSKAAAIAQVCNLLSARNEQAAVQLLRNVSGNQPMSVPISLSKNSGNLPPARSDRKYSDEQKTQLFLRDGFIDRYSGDRLIFPGVLRLLSHLFPEEFPYHPNWKHGVCHSWYWELYPTVDHVDSAGADSEDNWVTTSMMRNLKKSNISLQDHGWTLLGTHAGEDWDGLVRWYVDFIASRRALVKVPPLKRWYAAAKKALASGA
jgi:hypothetical protein